MFHWNSTIFNTERIWLNFVLCFSINRSWKTFQIIQSRREEALECNDVHGLCLNNDSSSNNHATKSLKKYPRNINGIYIEAVCFPFLHMAVGGNRRKGVTTFGKDKSKPFLLWRVPPSPCIEVLISSFRILSFCRHTLFKNNQQTKYTSPIGAFSLYYFPSSSCPARIWNGIWSVSSEICMSLYQVIGSWALRCSYSFFKERNGPYINEGTWTQFSVCSVGEITPFCTRVNRRFKCLETTWRILLVKLLSKSSKRYFSMVLLHRRSISFEIYFDWTIS